MPVSKLNGSSKPFQKPKKRALITGITGQDGSYLAELLLQKGYEVHGIKRRSSSFNTSRIDHLLADWHDSAAPLLLHFADLTDANSLSRLLFRIAPDEIYHLGAQSHVRVSFDIPEYTGDVTALGTTRLLEAIRETQLPAKFYNAASSEMFGQAEERPQNEFTPLRPRSPYGCAKLYSYWMTVNAREGQGSVRSQRHPFQSRITASRRNLRQPQSHARGCADLPRPAGQALSRQSGRGTRLGLRARIRGRHLDDDAAGSSRGLCPGHR